MFFDRKLPFLPLPIYNQIWLKFQLIGANGELIQAPSFSLILDQAKGLGDDWGEGLGGSSTPPLQAGSVGEMMVGECYNADRFTQNLGNGLTVKHSEEGKKSDARLVKNTETWQQKYMAKCLFSYL